MKKLYIFPILLVFILNSEVQAQRYGSAVGLRIGSNDYSRTVGISAQQRILKHVTLEGIVQSDFSRNTTMHLLVERHRPIVSKRFNYYYGAGVSVGHEESFIKNPETRQIMHTYGNATTGVDLIAGVEMTVLNTVISLDYKPNVNLAGREEFYRGQVAISARMILVKSKEQNKRKRKKARAKRRGDKTPFGQQLKETFNFKD